MTTERGTGQTQFATYDEDGGEHRIPLAQTAGPIELDVSNSSGEVTVRAGSGPDAVVRFEKHGGRGNDAELVIEVRDSRIKIEPRNEGGLGGLLKRNHGTFDIEVELPRERLADGSARVRLRTASGEVEVDDIPGELQVNTASGDARISHADGDVTVQSASGDVALIRPRGRITTRTASGDILLDDAVISRFVVATASGDIRLAGTLTGNEASKIDAVSGDISLHLSAAAISELRYATVSGDATIGGALQKVAARTWRLGEGAGPTISVKTVSGDLHIEGIHASGETEPIRQSDRAGDTLPISTPPTPPPPPTPPAAPTPPASVAAAEEVTRSGAEGVEVEAAPAPLGDAERLEVLQALERGEIDIDEALSRLGDPDEPAGI